MKRIERMESASVGFRDRIVAHARGWIDTPYHHQASLRGVGCDCLGLIRGVWRDLYGFEAETPPAYAPFWGSSGRMPERDDLLVEAFSRHFVAASSASAGDAILFRRRPGESACHCAIATGSDGMIHTLDAHPVCEVPLTAPWRRRLSHIFSFPSPAAVSSRRRVGRSGS